MAAIRRYDFDPSFPYLGDKRIGGRNRALHLISGHLGFFPEGQSDGQFIK